MAVAILLFLLSACCCFVALYILCFGFFAFFSNWAKGIQRKAKFLNIENWEGMSFYLYNSFRF